MRGRPDLAYLAVPDAAAMDAAQRLKSMDKMDKGTNLREDGVPYEYQWPEAGPSESSKARGLGEEEAGPAMVGPFGAKIVAAMTGAMVTSLLMTPFDVLKTRLQTVRPSPIHSAAGAIGPIRPPRPSTECCQTTVLTSPSPRPRFATTSSSAGTNPLTCFSAASPGIQSNGTVTLDAAAAEFAFAPRQPSTPIAPPSGCLHPSKWAGIWGEAASFEQAMARVGGVSTARAGAGVVAGGFWNEIATVRRETGVRGLWKGVGTTLTMSIPSSAIYMLGYEELLTIISPFFTGSNDPAANASSLNRSPGAGESTLTTSLTPAPLVAGSLARTFSATIISPIEMFRTRLQALPTELGSPTYASTAKDMSALVKSKGMTVLWRGLGPTLWRDVPFSGIYWAGFELLKSHLSSPQSPLPPLTPLTTSFISGALSGTLSALLTQPFDVLKTRRQVFTPSADCSPAALTHRASTLPLALHVIRTEGWGALFAGVVPRCGKVAPACGLMIACYEGVGRYLGGRGE